MKEDLPISNPEGMFLFFYAKKFIACFPFSVYLSDIEKLAVTKGAELFIV